MEEQKAAAAAGRPKRRKLSEVLEGASSLGGKSVAMTADRSRTSILLAGVRLTRRGAPAREVLGVALEWVKTVEIVGPNAKPLLQGMSPAMSMEITLVPSDKELAQAAARELYYEDEESTLVLPDTTLTVQALGAILGSADNELATAKARALGVGSSIAIHRLGLTLIDADIQRVFVDGTETLTRDSVVTLVENLDRAAALPPKTVSIFGVLHGANSRGEGQFEITTDEREVLPDVFGPRRNPGTILHGPLTPKAHRQIREENLWDRHVVARIQVSRIQRGQVIKVQQMRLMSVKPRYSDGESEGNGPTEAAPSGELRRPAELVSGSE